MKLSSKFTQIILIILGIIVVAGALKFAQTLGLFLLLGGIAGVLLALAVYVNPQIGLVWMVLALPFERLLTIDVGGFTAKPIHIVILATLLGWFFASWQNRVKIRFTSLSVIAAIFWIVGLLSLNVSIDSSRTVQILIFWLVALIGFWLVTQLIQTKEDLVNTIVFLLIATAILAVFGFYQIAGDLSGLPSIATGIREGYGRATFGFPRVHATLPEPLYYGNYLLIPFFISTVMFLWGGIQNKIGRKWLLVITLLILANIVLTVSRGAYLALGVGGLLIIIWQYKVFFQLKNIVVIISALALGAMLFVGFLTLSDPRSIEEFLQHISLEKKESESIVTRVDATELAYTAWQNSPVLGIGLGGYGLYELEDKYESYLTDYYPIVNNQYVETLAETGVIGEICLLIFLCLLLWRSFKAYIIAKDKTVKGLIASLTIGVVAILVQYLTFSTIYIVYIWFFIGLLVAAQEFAFTKKFNS